MTESDQLADEPAWLAAARGELGVREVPGEGNNPRVLQYLSTVLKTRLPRFLRDETAWCSAFVNWCMLKAAVLGTDKPNARSWLAWGRGLADPRYGAVCVLKRGVLPWQGHVGFVVAWDAQSVVLLGGNQSNRVCRMRYPRARVLGYRWPA